MNRILLSLGMLALLCGCSDKALLQEKDEEIARLNSEVEMYQNKLEVQRQEFRESQRRRMQEWQEDAREQVAQVVEDRDQMEREYRLEINRLRGLLEEKEGSPKPSPSEASEAPPAAAQLQGPIIREVSLSEPVTFPLSISGVAGRQVVTGVHTNTSYVKTDETFKDRYGKVQPVIETVREPEQQLDYEVTFTVTSEESSPVRFEARAGLETVPLLLGAGETRDFSIPANRGASLTIEASGQVHSYPIDF